MWHYRNEPNGENDNLDSFVSDGYTIGLEGYDSDDED